MIQQLATVSVQVVVRGTHCWEDAPAHRAYLSVPHPHNFTVEAELYVNSQLDRCVEFHDLAQEVLR